MISARQLIPQIAEHRRSAILNPGIKVAIAVPVTQSYGASVVVEIKTDDVRYGCEFFFGAEIEKSTVAFVAAEA